MAKFPASVNRHYLLCYSTVVGGSAKGVRSASGDQKWVGEGVRDGADFGLQQGSSPSTPKTKVLTNEALMEEASRWGIELGPLRMILADGREAEVSRLSRLANEMTEEGMKDVLDRAPYEIIEEGNEVGNKNPIDVKGSYSELRSGEIFRIGNYGFKGLSGWQCVFTRPVSEHFPILLEGGELRRGPSPFKFENMWLKVEGFKELLKAWWERDTFNGSTSFILAEKLKVVKSKLKEWNRDVFGRNLDVDALEAQFTKEEVYGALLGCSENKAPGPDDFTMAFWEFHDHSKFVKSLNTTFLVLIPKKLGAEDLRDFRPISLVGSLYKWLAKVLANRLKKVVGKVVSKAQGTFVGGRQILDAVLIANEAINSILKNNENGFMCKLDIEKASDNVDWSFLFTVMQKMGFGEKWIGWIKWCISIASFSMLINGMSKGFFQSSRGLRQDDPLSPYLFVIAMKVFSFFLKRVVDGGFMSGCKVKGRNEERVQIPTCCLLMTPWCFAKLLKTS
uniref:Reverse transcriptase domain-containing protein n=1 Tax=Vitis vinifera TaxID=29760 RepID=A5ALB7_VITVI|nr:hypothetical protein VITISV_011180 [Vitis vinifera]